MNYYNENDPKAAAWLRELIKQGHIPKGFIDERSIIEVQPGDLAGYIQCHFFAGIGGWPLALRLAGWPEDRPVWTGSCPCQPFSGAGKRLGKSDPRHLWPQLRRLIRKCRPAIVFGEQVASKDGRLWLDGVFADLEALAYANCAADMCAAGVGKEADVEICDELTGAVVYCGKGVVGPPHIRQRLWWMAHANIRRWATGDSEAGPRAPKIFSGQSGAHACGMANVQGARLQNYGLAEPEAQIFGAYDRGKISRVDDPSSNGAGCGNAPIARRDGTEDGLSGTTGTFGGVEHPNVEGRERESFRLLGAGSENYWSRFDILHCLDGKARRIEPGTFPLAHGVPGRVGLLRGYGNAIVPEVAAQFIQACEEAINEIETIRRGCLR